MFGNFIVIHSFLHGNATTDLSVASVLIIESYGPRAYAALVRNLRDLLTHSLGRIKGTPESLSLRLNQRLSKR